MPPLQRQYVITLSGKGEIELSDGTRVSLNPGRILSWRTSPGRGTSPVAWAPRIASPFSFRSLNGERICIPANESASGRQV
jgi:hypothetical protein